jgi:hypothetical protein
MFLTLTLTLTTLTLALAMALTLTLILILILISTLRHLRMHSGLPRYTIRTCPCSGARPSP